MSINIVSQPFIASKTGTLVQTEQKIHEVDYVAGAGLEYGVKSNRHI